MNVISFRTLGGVFDLNMYAEKVSEETPEDLSLVSRIKLEPQDSDDSASSTQPQEHVDDARSAVSQVYLDDAINTGNDKREVLVHLGLGRKRIFILDGSESLATQFKSHVSSDPAFAELMKGTFPVFQEFNSKFRTWVDVNPEESLRDGAVLKAMFFPQTIDIDTRNPGSLKRKRDHCDVEGMSERRRTIEDEQSSFHLSVNNFNHNETKTVSETKTVDYTPNSTLGTSVPCNVSVSKNGNEATSPATSAYQAPLSVVEMTRTPMANPPFSKEKQSAKPKSNGAMKSRASKPKIIQFSSNEIFTKVEKKKRLLFAKHVKKSKWRNEYDSVFTAESSFVLEGNSIKHVTLPCNSAIKKKMETFWGCIFTNGARVIVPVGSKLTPQSLSHILLSHVAEVQHKYYRKSSIFFCYDGDSATYVHPLVSGVLKKAMGKRFGWSSCLRDIYPLTHVWELVATKVKHVYCNSKTEMIDIICDVWLNDLDIPLMHESSVSSLLPVVDSIIHEQGGMPKIQEVWKNN